MIFMSDRRSPVNPGTTPKGPVAALDVAADKTLLGVLQRAEALRALDRALQACLPQPLSQHAQLGNVRDGILIFIVDAPIWKAKLRLLQAELVDTAISAGFPAKGVSVKVSPKLPEPTPERGPQPISARSRDALRQTAESVSDPQLRDVLLRLASMPDKP